MADKQTLLIGAHVSAAGGLENAIKNAEAIGANVMQIFGSSPQTWLTRMPSDDAIRAYREKLAASAIKKVFLHAPYLINLASGAWDIYKSSVRSLAGHLAIAEKIGAEGVVFHLGSAGNAERAPALEREAEGIRGILDAVPGTAKLIMENTAGGGGKIGTVEDLGWLFKKLRSERIGVCFDTAHAFEAGAIKNFTRTSVAELCNAFHMAFGIGHLTAIHANDSKTAFDSHHDRHENIGEGHIGLAGFRALAQEPMLRGKPWILEVPGFSGTGPDKKNIEALRSCFV